MAALGLLAFLTEGLSLTAGWAVCRWARDGFPENFLARPFFNGHAWQAPAEVVASWGPSTANDQARFEAEWKNYTLGWCPWRPWERYILSPDPNMACVGRTVSKLRLTLSGWKLIGYFEHDSCREGELEEDHARHDVPWVIWSR